MKYIGSSRNILQLANAEVGEYCTSIVNGVYALTAILWHELHFDPSCGTIAILTEALEALKHESKIEISLDSGFPSECQLENIVEKANIIDRAVGQAVEQTVEQAVGQALRQKCSKSYTMSANAATTSGVLCCIASEQILLNYKIGAEREYCGLILANEEESIEAGRPKFLFKLSAKLAFVEELLHNPFHQHGTFGYYMQCSLRKYSGDYNKSYFCSIICCEESFDKNKLLKLVRPSLSFAYQVKYPDIKNIQSR